MDTPTEQGKNIYLSLRVHSYSVLPNEVLSPHRRV